MSKVTVTGNVQDITGSVDPDPLAFSSPVVRGGVLSTRPKKVDPNRLTGAFSVQLEAGPAEVIVRNKKYKFTAADGDLLGLIMLGVAIPPSTPLELLQEAVDAWADSYGDGHFVTADDLAKKYSRPVSGVPKSDLATGVQSSLDRADAALPAQSATTLYAPVSHSHPTTAIIDLAEYIQDTVAGLLKAGANVTTSYDDAANTFTINAAASGGTTDAEVVRDTIGGALVAGSGVSVTVDDAGDTITIAVAGVPQSAVTGLTAALAGKEPTITAGTTAQFWRGDKTWQALTKAAVGLGSVDNTADAVKAVLSATKLATARTINGVSFDGTANITVPSTALTPESYGAVGDGTTDDTTALQNLFNAAAGKSVYLASGKSYRHTAVLTISGDNTTIHGGGILLATAEQTSAVLVTGKNVTMRGITLKMALTTQRWNNFEMMKLRVAGDRFHAEDITIDGSAAAGIYTMAHYCTYLKVLIKGTRADGAFTSEGSHDTAFIACTADSTGDDGFSVVSYAGSPCYRYVNVGCVVINAGARGMSCVGGYDILFSNFYINVTQAAGIIVAAESDSYANISHVSMIGGKIVGANASTGIDQGAVLISSAQARTIQFVDISSVVVRDTRATASGQLRVIRYDTSSINDVSVSGVTIVNGPALIADLFQVTAEANRINLVNVFRDGLAIHPLRVSAAAITLGPPAAVNIFTGTTAITWTLPAVAGNVGKQLRIKNRGTAVLTISRAGSDQIYATAAVTTVTVAAGASLTLVDDGTYWTTL